MCVGFLLLALCMHIYICVCILLTVSYTNTHSLNAGCQYDTVVGVCLPLKSNSVGDVTNGNYFKYRIKRLSSL